MKNKPILFILSCAAFLMSSASAYVEVMLEPEKASQFRDLAFDGRDGKKQKQHFVNEMSKYLQNLADQELPPDSTLTITFTEVDMAGEFEVWRRPPNDQIRIMKDIYAPRLEFTYVLTGDDGAILKQGEAKLSDPNYLRNTRRLVGSHDELFHEKELLRNWVKRDLSDF